MKDKEWLKNEIEIMGSETSENYPHEQMVAKEVVLNLIDQLDEPEIADPTISKKETVVIPWFVADYIKASKENNESLNQAFAFIDDKENKELWNWMSPTIYEGKCENQESFARAWLDGYTVEPEPMYLVKVNDQGSWLYLKSMQLYKNVEERTDLNSNFEAWKERAIKFTNKQQAEGIAKFFNGEVVEVAE